MEERKKLRSKGRRKAALLLILLSTVLLLQTPLKARAEEAEKPKTDVLIGISTELTVETTIKVLDESKKPIKNARLSVYVKAGDYKGYLPLGVTLADGTYKIKLPHGTYRCKVEASGYESAEGEFTLKTTDKDPRSFTITLKKKAEEPKPPEKEQLLSVAVIAKFTDGSPAAGYGIELHSKVQKAVLDGNGYNMFNNVELGNHSIYLFDMKGKEAASTDFVLAKSDAVKLDGKDMVSVGLDTQMLTIDLEIDPETGEVNLTRAREGLYFPTPADTKTVVQKVPVQTTRVVTEKRVTYRTKKAGMAKTSDNIAGGLPVYMSLFMLSGVGIIGLGAARRRIRK